VGDLRVSHFLAVHALQVLPLAAYAARWLPWPAARWAVVAGTAAAMLAATLLSFRQALLGRPVW
jgi:hypothetical protein